MYRSIVVALTATLLSTACGAPEPAAPAPELGQTQGALSTLATYDSTRRTPRCASVGTGCDSGTLLRGRASLGPEQNAPNTLGGTCADGTSGAYHSDESLDQLEVLTVDGTSLAPGKTVRIRATVWAWSGGGSDKLDLYTTGNADAPAWTFLTTLTPTAAGAQTLTATYTLPSGPVQAVRGIFRYQGTAAPCGTGSYTDNDDLVFAVQSASTPTVRLTAPAAGAVLQNTANLTADFSGPTAPARVSFYEGTRWLGDDTTAPYSHAWNTRSVANGSYSLTARALDTAGATLATSGAVQVQVRNDLAAPTVSLTAPTAGAVLRNTVVLTASASDDIGVTRVEFYRDGIFLGTAASASSPSYSWNTKNVANGPLALTARAYDAAGNVTTSSAVTATVDNDTATPTTTITSPRDGTLTSGTLLLAATANDERGLTRLEFLFNGVVVCNLTLNGELSVSRTCSVSASTGSHTLQSRATDVGGNGSTSPYVRITVDSTPPTVSITSPAAGAPVSGSVTFAVSATDNQAVARTELLVDGWHVATRTSPPFDLSWDSRSVSNGSHTVQVYAYDTLGNLGQSALQPVMVANDVTPPTTSILSPVASQEVFSVMRISARADDAAGVVALEVFVDGVAISGNSYPGNPSVTAEFLWDPAALSEGFHQIYSQARDAAGNVGVSPGRTFYVDRTPPQVAITSLANGQQVTGMVTVDVTASDDRAIRKVELLVDGLDVTSATQVPYQLHWDTRMYEDGTHLVRALAFDTAGNITRSTTLEVVVSNGEAPVVQLLRPGSGTVGGLVQLEATASADVGIAQVDFWLDTQLLGTVTAPPYVLSWNSVGTEDGNYQLRAMAVSTTGKVTSSEPVALTVVNDQGPPMVDLRLRDSSTDQQFPGDEVYGVVDVEADAFDESTVTLMELYLDGVLTVSVDPQWDGLRYFWDTSTVPGGAHTLEVRAYDSYGKVGIVTRNLVVANDRLAPTVHIHMPSEGQTLSGTVTVVVPAYDDVGITRIDLLVDGAPIMTTLSHHGDFPWDTRWHDSGPHTLTARAYDATGKVGESAPVTVTVLNENVTGQAAYDDSLQAPGCTWVGTGCDSGVLLVGSGTEGFEPHAPNTLAGSCGDATATGFHSASTIDRLWVDNPYGSVMTAGEWVGVQLNVFTTSPQDEIDVYSAADAANPTWTLVATLLPYYSGPQMLNASFQLPAGTLQAVRAVLRQGGTPEACAEGVIADHDDLFFAVQ